MNNELDPEIIQEDLDEIINEYSKIDFGPEKEVNEPKVEYQAKRYWLIAPGEGAYL